MVNCKELPISDQLCNDINNCDCISVCLDETTVIKSSASLAIIPKEKEIHKELLKLVNIPERTRGTDICEVAVNKSKLLKIDLKYYFRYDGWNPYYDWNRNRYC